MGLFLPWPKRRLRPASGKDVPRAFGMRFAARSFPPYHPARTGSGRPAKRPTQGEGECHGARKTEQMFGGISALCPRARLGRGEGIPPTSSHRAFETAPRALAVRGQGIDASMASTGALLGRCNARAARRSAAFGGGLQARAVEKTRRKTAAAWAETRGFLAVWCPKLVPKTKNRDFLPSKTKQAKAKNVP